MKKVIVITGPTAVGKTRLSILLAQHFKGEIINADASQMRKELNIGTAKITKNEMNGVKHHLIDFLEPTQKFSIKEFQDAGRELISNIDVPFIVGGSGLYIEALISDYNLDTSTTSINKYDDLSNNELYNMLLQRDKEAAEKIHLNNRRRLLRYLQITDERGTVASNPPIPLYDSLTICLTRDRKELYDNINKRCEQMLENGWIDECVSLKEKGIDLNNVKEIGYKEINQYLNKEINYTDLFETIKQKQRRYAKRQLTWFRNKMNCFFFDLGKEDNSILFDKAKEHLKSK